MYFSRERLIHEYINSFNLFDDTLSKAKEGIEFYKTVIKLKYIYMLFILFIIQQSTKLKSLNERLTNLQSQQIAKSSVDIKLSSQYNASKQERDSPVIPDRPRLKDYLATMKPETWGSTATNHSSMKVEDNKYIPSTISNLNTNNSFHNDALSKPGSIYSNVPQMIEQTHTSLPLLNSHNPYQLQSSLPFTFEQSMSYQKPTYNQQSNTYNQNPNLIAQNYNAKPQVTYNVNAQSYPQQQQQVYPSQSFQFQQSVYQPYMSQQMTQPTTQTFSMQHSDLQYPSTYQYQNFSDPNRSVQQPVQSLPAKFDPYRPQPVGAYDIPTNFSTTPLIQPQDVYRPGGLLGLNQMHTMPTSSLLMNTSNNDQNQYAHYIPASNSISSSFAHLSINSMSNR